MAASPPNVPTGRCLFAVASIIFDQNFAVIVEVIASNLREFPRLIQNSCGVSILLVKNQPDSLPQALTKPRSNHLKQRPHPHRFSPFWSARKRSQVIRHKINMNPRLLSLRKLPQKQRRRNRAPVRRARNIVQISYLTL